MSIPQEIPMNQQELENHALALGRERFFRRLDDAKKKGEGASAGAGLSLVRLAIQPLAENVEQHLVTSLGRRGVRHIAVKMIDLLGPTEEAAAEATVASRSDVAAYMAVRAVISAAMRKTALPIAAMDLADLVVDELRYRRFESQAGALYDHKVKSFDTSNVKHRKRSLDASMRFAGIATDDLDLNQEHRLALGMWLIDRVLESTDLVVVQDVSLASKGKKGPRATKLLVLTSDALEWLDERNEALQLMWPVALPMVEQPLPWGPGQRGGYKHGLRGKHPFVRGISKAHAKSLAQVEMPAVYEALNAIQSTPWRINPDVLQLMVQVIDNGGHIAGIPALGRLEIPSEIPRIREFDVMLRRRRAEEDETPLTGELAQYAQQIRERRKRVAPIHAENYQRKLARREMVRLLDVANLLKDAAQLFFPHNLDFRGRIYPVANYLTPQGDDKSKGLLTFAEGRPLGREGARYLAQHGMSCLDETPAGVKVGTMTIAERVEWVEQNTDKICDVAADPLSHRWWSAADSPWQFYAFCCEWARLQQWMHAGNAEEDFVSALPCSVDGTCNGLQHWGAMLRCESTGAAVNLTPAARPSDIYMDVQKRVLQQLEVDAAGGDVSATLWLTSGLITRKFCKRPVMTMPYGSKTFGFRSQILQYLQTRGDNPQESKVMWSQTRTHFSSADTKKEGDLLKAALTYVAKVISQAISGTVVKASEGMTWMQKGARLVGADGKCVTWTVPGTGFQVRQEYYERKMRRVKTTLCGALYRPAIHENTTTPAMYRQANAIAPNFVHSMDAAALMTTVQTALHDGVSSFAMVHDSYGSVAGCCALLNRATRQSFVSLYTKYDVIETLHSAFNESLSEERQAKLPEAPSKGTLDLSGVLASDFFFA